VAVREESNTKKIENRALRRIFGLNRCEVRGGKEKIL
jgi:hypothetical protein